MTTWRVVVTGEKDARVVCDTRKEAVAEAQRICDAEQVSVEAHNKRTGEAVAYWPQTEKSA